MYLPITWGPYYMQIPIQLTYHEAWDSAFRTNFQEMVTLIISEVGKHVFEGSQLILPGLDYPHP